MKIDDLVILISDPDADMVRTIARQLAEQGIALPDPDGLRVEISHEPVA